MCIFVRVSLFPSFNIIKELLGSTGSRFFIGGEVGIFDVDPAFWTRIPLFGPGSHPDPTPDPTFGTPYSKHFATPRNKHERYATAFSVTTATSTYTFKKECRKTKRVNCDARML